jgi:hypothetical protein
MLLLFFSQWIPVDGHLDQQDREQINGWLMTIRAYTGLVDDH